MSGPLPKPAAAGAASIVLIEDDLSLQQCLRGFLEDQGYPTQAAGTRAQGCDLLRRIRPTICVLDLNLPDGSGLDILRTIVNERLAVKVIVMSAFPIKALSSQFPDTTLVALLTKPVSPQHLMQVVDKIISDRQG